jgi:hypothetical protein
MRELMKLGLTWRIVVAAAWIAFCGSYSVWAGVGQSNWLAVLFGLAALVGAVGVVLRWRWSEWLVYIVAASIVIVWLYGLVVVLRAGSFHTKLRRSLRWVIVRINPDCGQIVLPGTWFLANWFSSTAYGT